MVESEIIALIILFGTILLFIFFSSEEQEQEWSQQHLHQDYTPREFEILISSLWEDKGYNVQLSKEGPDGGVDVKATKQGVSTAIEVKQYNPKNNKVSGPTVQKVFAASNQHGHNKAVVATSSQFTKPAKEACQSLKCLHTSVELYDGTKLVNELKQSSIEPPFKTD